MVLCDGGRGTGWRSATLLQAPERSHLSLRLSPHEKIVPFQRRQSEGHLDGVAALWDVVRGGGGGQGVERIALTLASISWDCAPLNHFSASGRTVSATRTRLWPISFLLGFFFFWQTEPKFVLKVLQEFLVLWHFSKASRKKPFFKPADEGRTAFFLFVCFFLSCR